MEKEKRFVGKYAYGIYPAPAITCESNGRLVSVEGKVTGIGKNGIGMVGVIIQGTVFRLSDIKCPTLHYEGEVYTVRAKAREYTIKERKRKWEKSIGELNGR